MEKEMGNIQESYHPKFCHLKKKYNEKPFF